MRSSGHGWRSAGAECPVILLGMLSLLSALRPRQWSKNLMVLVGLAFSGKACQTDTATAALITTGLFCLVSSAIYLINDVLDRERDRAQGRGALRGAAIGGRGAVLYRKNPNKKTFLRSPQWVFRARFFV